MFKIICGTENEQLKGDMTFNTFFERVDAFKILSKYQY